MSFTKLSKYTAIFVLVASIICSCDKEPVRFRVLYWNILNGMWDGQGDNYDRFVAFVREQDPDVCVWCEAQSNWQTNNHENLEPEDRYLVEHWGDLAARYGHEYWGIGGHRDNHPQVITSKYPIIYIDRIVGEEPDSVVRHGAGWATVDINGKTVNIVTVHCSPQGGNEYRKMEMEFICGNTIGKDPESKDQYWMMLGDFNSSSRLDNDYYRKEGDNARSAFLVHDYILENTPYIDVIKELYPDKFKPSYWRRNSRIDFVYCTKPLFDRVTYADFVWDSYTTPLRDWTTKWGVRPSDHLPIVVDFDMR